MITRNCPSLDLSDAIYATDTLIDFDDEIIDYAEPAIALPKQTTAPGPTDCFMGGRGFLPKGFSWPIGREGIPLVHVIQLNFAQMQEALDDEASEALQQLLPAHGLFQVFVSPTPDFGESRKTPWVGNGVEFRYFPEPKGGFRTAPARSYAADFGPFTAEARYVAENPIALAPKHILLPAPLWWAEEVTYIEWDDDVDDEYIELRNDLFQNHNTFIGGTPDFMQEPYMPPAFHFLQLGNTINFEFPYSFIWEKFGIAHVFLKPEVMQMMREGTTLIMGSANPNAVPGALWHWDTL